MAKTKTQARRKESAGGGSVRTLKAYREKRNFQSTPEPDGRERTSTRAMKGLRFCVQKHLASRQHYDFRLEHHGVLVSWAVPKGPSLDPAVKRLAMAVEDHPLEYRTFEGVIPEGYGAGVVMLWDEGMWRPAEGFEDVGAALKKGELKFGLEGVKLKGSWVLVRTHRKGDEEGRSWLLIKHRDEWAGAVDVTEEMPNSVKSFGDFADILGAKSPSVWESNREGGSAPNAMLREVMAEARRRSTAKPRRGRRDAKKKKTVAKIAKGQRSQRK